MQTRLRSVLALVVLALGMSLALVPSTAQAAPAKPKVGQCHQLTSAEGDAESDSKPAVPCRKRHNTWTYAVVQGPADMASLSEDAYLQLGGLCNAPFKRVLGSTAVKRAQTAYSWLWFTPSAEQLAAGQHWVRCDLVLLNGSRFAPLPKLERPVLSGEIRDSVRRCLTGKHLVTTACTKSHSYRSISAFRVAQASYPTEGQFMRLARARCPKGWDYVTWPGPITWSSGGRVLTCFDKTSR